jgi:hypothetical protein
MVAHSSCDDEFFIDRDATHFRHILNYLRGSPSFPSTESGMNELGAEADFYCLPELKTLVEVHKKNIARDSIAHKLEVLGTKLQR